MGSIPDYELKTIEEIKKISAKQAVRIKIDPEKKPKITESKFGGMPYWDMSKEYPVRKDGTLLMLLAQINLDELNREGKNPDNKLPKSGMLQFFIDGNDDVCGMDFENTKDEQGRLAQDGYRVVYHKTVNYEVSEKDIKEIGMPVSTDEEAAETSPVWDEFGLTFALEETYIGMDDYRFEEYFSKAAEKSGWKINENESFYSNFSDEGRDFLYEEIEPSGHWMLGYPYFTQSDPREEYGDRTWEKTYTIQLFQMDSDYGDGEDYVMWGDAGVANFFINEDDLAKEDFGDVLYSWDCC